MSPVFDPPLLAMLTADRRGGLLVGKLGLASASAPLGIATTGLVAQLKWVIAGAVATAAVMTTVSVATATPPEPRPSAAPALSATTPRSAPPQRAATPSPSPPRTQPEFQLPEPIEVGTVRRPVDPGPPEDRLAAEVAYIRATRSSVTSGAADARHRLERYAQLFPDGRLRLEVSALELELRCRRAQAGTAALEEFQRRNPGSSLVKRLSTVCRETVRQKPRGPETQPM